MAQPEFMAPDFIDDNDPDSIHERMMENLPDDIDNTPGGFPSDLTMPSAIEKSELIGFHLVRALMIAFPQYAWDEWLDMHGQQVHIIRHEAAKARGVLELQGEPGTEIPAGTIFCVPAIDDIPAVEFETDTDCVIDETGTVKTAITAVEAGPEANVKSGSVSIMDEPMDEITGINNEHDITGGAAAESDDDYYDRIAAEYENSRTYLGNDRDYKRWAQEAGAGDCIVVPAAEGPGTVKLVLVDVNGGPANGDLVEKVWEHIYSPHDRAGRLMPTACAKLICVPAETVTITYFCTGLEYDEKTSLEQIKLEFREKLKAVYSSAKSENMLRYNDVRPLISSIVGVQDFDTFLMKRNDDPDSDGMSNITLASEEYPDTGDCEFS